MQYKGWKIQKYETDEELGKFYNGKVILPDLLENQYLFIADKTGEIVDSFVWQKGALHSVKWDVIPNIHYGKVRPRNPEQQIAFHLMQDMSIPIKILTGPHGTAKTMTTVVHGLNALDTGQFKKLVWVRSNYTAAGIKEIGFLGGTIEEKLWPFILPLADHCGGEKKLKSLMASGRIAMEHIGFLRGRSFEDTLVLCSEAQNLTVPLVKLLLGRISDGSHLWLEGDVKAQRDSAIFEDSPGLEAAIETFKGNELFGYVHLEKNERSRASNMANLLDNWNGGIRSRRG